MAGDGADVPEILNIKVLGEDNSVIQFKIKRKMCIKKVMDAYCARTGLTTATIRFRFDGQAINETDTAFSLGIEEGDTIEVFQQMTGGQNIFLDYY